MPTAAETVQKAWIRLLQWIALAQGYPLAYQIMAIGAGVPPNPVLDRLLSTLLYIQVVALFDQALADVIEERKLPRPPDWKADLYHRIERVGALLCAKDDCHALRERRRALAHAPESFVTWADLGKALDVVERELQALQLVGARPIYQAYAERSATRAPRHPDGLFGFDCVVGLKQDGRVVAHYRWSSDTLKDDAE